jgi:hypothetical protein
MFLNIDEIFKISKRAVALLQVQNTDSFQTMKLLFTRATMKQYQTYLDGFPRIERALARCQQNEQFDAYVKSKQRDSSVQLETLLWQPLERVETYYKLLKTAIGIIPDDHDCKVELTEVFAEWQKLRHATELLQKVRKNEEHLLDAQLSFPFEKLRLVPNEEEIGGVGGGGAADGGVGAMGGKRRWSLATMIKKVTPESRKMSYQGAGPDATTPAEVKLAEVEFRRYKLKQDAPTTPADERREYIIQGAITMGKSGTKAGTEDKSRSYLFLFSDMLLLAKPKGRGMFVLRDRIELTESWIGPKPESLFKGFTIGGPHCREREIINTPAEANLNCSQWHDALAGAILKAKEGAAAATPPRNANVYPFVPEKSKSTMSSSLPVFLPIEVTIMNTMEDLILRVLQMLQVENPTPSNYVIFEITEFGLQKCAAWVSPMALLCAGSRASVHRSRCHFIMRQSQASELRVGMLPPNVSSLVTVGGSPKKSPKGKPGGSSSSKWSDWGGRAKAMLPKKMFGAKGGSGSAAPVATGNLPKYMAPKSAVDGRGAGAVGMLYGRPLDDVMVEGELPMPVQNMLARLYQDGPMARGLFRVSANAKLLRQVKERLDSGQEVDMVEVPILAVGATLKEYLRNMPESVFPVKMYHQFIACNAIEDDADRQVTLKRLVEALPASNLVLLKAIVPMLTEICAKKEENEMTPRNVGICIGQSLMCPPTTEDVLKNDVPPFMEYLLLHTGTIFGELEPLAQCVKMDDGYLEVLKQGEDLDEAHASDPAEEEEEDGSERFDGKLNGSLSADADDATDPHAPPDRRQTFPGSNAH